MSDVSDGRIVIVAEGDSITAPTAPRYYAADYATATPQVEFFIQAVGGSMIRQLNERQQAGMDLKPDILTVFIGANDFGSDAQGYAQRVFDYVAPFRAMGTKVYVATVLPTDGANSSVSPALRNAARREYAQIIENAVGNQIDGIIDFGREPIIGDDGSPLNRQLFNDGLHPTWRNHNGGIGGHDYLFDVYKEAIDAAVASLDNP